MLGQNGSNQTPWCRQVEREREKIFLRTRSSSGDKVEGYGERRESFWERTFLLPFSLLVRKGGMPGPSTYTEYGCPRWPLRGQHAQPGDILLNQLYTCLFLKAFKIFKEKKKWNSVFLYCLGQFLYGLYFQVFGLAIVPWVQPSKTTSKNYDYMCPVQSS